MNASKLLFPPLLVGCMALSACNSQMDDIDEPLVRPASPEPAGFYLGTRTSILGDAEVEVVALLDGSGRFRMASSDGDEIYSGLYETNDRNLTVAARRFTPTPPLDDPDTPEIEAEPQPLTVVNLSAEGNYNQDSNLQFSYTAADGDFGTIELSYQKSDYEVRSDLPLLEGDWGQIDSFGAPTIAISIDQAGGLGGEDEASGCTYSGSFKLIDLHYNLYALNLRKQCTVDGGGAGTGSVTLNGLATLLVPRVGSKELLLIAASSTDSVLLRLKPL